MQALGERKEQQEMTLDEAIKHAEEVAEKNEENASWFWDKEYSTNYKKCIKCASEHRQLAEWLKELKRLREQTKPLAESEEEE